MCLRVCLFQESFDVFDPLYEKVSPYHLMQQPAMGLFKLAVTVAAVATATAAAAAAAAAKAAAPATAAAAAAVCCLVCEFFDVVNFTMFWPPATTSCGNLQL